MATKSALIPVFLLPVALAVACSDDETEPQPKVFNFALTTANETPPCTDAGVNATGNATVTIPVDNSSVMVNVTYSGLSGPVTAGHIHSGGAAAPGPVVLPFGPPLAVLQDADRGRLRPGHRDSARLPELRHRAQGGRGRVRQPPHGRLQAGGDPRRGPVSSVRRLSRPR